MILLARRNLLSEPFRLLISAGGVAMAVLTTKWYDVLAVGGLTLVMAVFASFVPVRRIGRVDPVAVFQA